MQIRLIRNATVRIRYHGLHFLTDPMLCNKGDIASWAGVAPNPTVALPFPVEEVLDGLDAVIATHLHQDHFDKAGRNMIAKDTPIYCQPGDEASLKEDGFQAIYPVSEEVQLDEMSLSRTGGQHGTGKWAERLAPVSGFVFRSPRELTLYWAGDTIWCDEVRGAIDRFRPDIILTHSCGAVLKDSGPIIMDDKQTVAVCKAAPWARVVAIHMEALDHATITRKALRRCAEAQGIGDEQLIIPRDGEVLTF